LSNNKNGTIQSWYTDEKRKLFNGFFSFLFIVCDNVEILSREDICQAWDKQKSDDLAYNYGFQNPNEICCAN